MNLSKKQLKELSGELTKENYFSLEMSRKYTSCSQIKSFNDCESKALAILNGEYEEGNKRQFLLGQYFHAWGEGEQAFDNFIETHRQDIFKKQTARQKKDGEFSKYADILALDNSINRIETFPKQYERLLKTIRNENVLHEVIITAKLFDVDFKIMIDCYAPSLGWFADLKLMKSLYDKNWDIGENKYVNFIKYYNYDLQMILYSEIEKIASKRNDHLEPIIAVVTKETIPDTALFTGFSDEKLREELLTKIQMDIERINNLKKGLESPFSCERCDWCKLNQPTRVFDFNNFYV